uniref:Uncharacterized protein n=1 Tax=Parastrongyloides trichosuri TaxID=131310 RepID=A0A0N4ZMT4_PARTI
MPNIFQLTTPDLVSLLRVLKPDAFSYEGISKLGNDNDSADFLVASNFSSYEDSKKIRSQITEWLLLNGFSTMHQFNKDPITNNWIIPSEKTRPVECGKYRVAQKVPIIIPDPLFDETPYLFNPTDDSSDSGFNSSRTCKTSLNDDNNNNLIRTKSATNKVLMQSFAPLSARTPREYYKQSLTECQNVSNKKIYSTNFCDLDLYGSSMNSYTINGTEKKIELPINNLSAVSLQNDLLPYCKNNNTSFCSGIFQIFMCQQRI